jgi:hypothetical protein
MASITPGTWNRLGLGVASMWTTLGLVSMLQPAWTLERFGVGAPATKRERTSVGLLLGSRDLAIAAALFALGSAERSREAGAVIMGTMIICAADVYIAWRSRRYTE